MMAQVRAAGRSVADVICEVLSTWPYPLRRVMQRHGLGRFRVTQKADLTRADDVYRAENAAPNDWIMVGQPRHAADLGAGAAVARNRGRSSLGGAPGAAADARSGAAPAAGPLAGGRSAAPVPGPVRRAVRQPRPARVGLLRRPVRGRSRSTTVPGWSATENWSLRLPPDFETLYRTRVAAAAAFDVPLALALACAARAPGGPEAAPRRPPTAVGRGDPGS